MKRPSRHYCKVCQTWTQGDTQSIRHHETGFRHLGKVRRSAKEADWAKRNAARQTEANLRELAQLDREAKIALGMSGKNKAFDGPTSRDNLNPVLIRDEYLKEDQEDQENMIHCEEDQVLGQYSIDSTIFLEGSMHQDLLTIGRKCQAVKITETMVDGETQQEEVWCDAVIEDLITYQSLERETQRDLSIRFLDGKEPIRIKVRDVRIVAPSPPPLPEPQNENGWSTVSVKYTIKEPERTTHQKELPKPVPSVVEEQREVDDALATFNPFGGKYKGFQLEGNSIANQALMNIEEEAEIPISKFHDDSSRQLKKIKFKSKRRKH